MTYIGNVVIDNINKEQSTNTNISELGKKGNFVDGTYEVDAYGYRGNTSVKVKVKNGFITSITIISYKMMMNFLIKKKI